MNTHAAAPRYIVHVNQLHIRTNVKHGKNLPVYTIKVRLPHLKSFTTIYCWEFKFRGEIMGENHMHDPLDCGARIYLTAGEGEMTFLDADGKAFGGITFQEAKARYKDDFEDSTQVCKLKAA